MSIQQNDPLLQVEMTCGSLLYELQIIWDEVGETDTERDQMLLELEQECLEVYRRKVDQANQCRAQLRRAIADSEAELAAICSAMGERPVHTRQSDQSAASLKEELRTILPQIEEARKRKSDRKNQFLEVLEQINKISNEIYKCEEYISSKTIVDETDLSLRKLEELHNQLHTLQREKSDRMEQVHDHLKNLNSLCLVLGVDFENTVCEIHPSLGDYEGPRNISNDTIRKLAAAIQKLREVKLQRMQRLQDLAATMLELWNLMDTPIEEQQAFQNVTCNVAASEQEITEPNTLSVDYINHVEAEVARLEELKSSKMKELVMKKRSELDEICRKTHMVPESESAMEHVIEAIESGAVDLVSVLENIELQIANVKGEAFSRKEVLEKVEKWLAACEEECWLEEYNRDDNRYIAGRGAHLTLKRAEKARALVNKLPAMVEALASKTIAWEKERGTEFTYDGIRLLSMLEEYNILRQEKEQESRRLRDQKKLQGQLLAEQEALYGSKPSPLKTQNIRKAPRMSTGGASNRRLSLGPLHSTKATPQSRPIRKSDRVQKNDQLLNQYHDNGFTAIPAGGISLDTTLPSKNQSFGAREAELTRIPFSPISTISSKANMMNLPNATKQTETSQKTVVATANSTPSTTPSKTTFIADEENRTPKVPFYPPATPSTISVPMQTAATPAHPPIPFKANPLQEILEDLEYSFEEKRAGFFLPKSNLKSVIQV